MPEPVTVGLTTPPPCRAFFSAQICAGVFPPSSANVRLATPTGAAAAFVTGANPTGTGALVPENALAPLNLLATFGLGREVSRSDCWKALDRSVKLLGASLSSKEGLVTGGCALARIAAISTF